MSTVTFIGAAPVVGVKAGNGSWPPTGVCSRPVFEYCSCCAAPTAVPSMYRRVSHWFATAVFVKYSVPVCVAPRESNSVSEVAWLKVFGSFGSNGVVGGCEALPGRLSTYCTFPVAAGGHLERRIDRKGTRLNSRH